jgi:molecular chaperone DnaK
MPQIEVTFDIDANGIVNVSAKDRATNKVQHITITASSGISTADIDKMVKEAEAHATDDKKRREVVEERNKLDSLIYNLEKNVRESGDKLSAATKEPVEEALKAARTQLDSQDIAVLQKAYEDLTKASHKMAEELYKSAPGAGPDAAQSQGAEPPPAQDKKAGGDDVVDAEFEESPRN